MKINKILNLFFALIFCQVSFAAQIFIVQAPQKDPEKVVPDIASSFAEVAPSIISLTPIVWSMTDPLYRDAYYAGKFNHDPNKVNLKDALEAAKAIQSPFVLWLEIETNSNGIKAVVQLFDSGSARKSFEKSYNIGAEIGGSSDFFSAMQSTARIAFFNMCEKPLKPFLIPSESNTSTPTTPDSTTKITPIEPDQTPTLNQSDEAKFIASIDEKLKASDTDGALLLLYDAIDMNPETISLRSKLITILSLMGNHALLMEECRNAILVDPSASSIRVQLIRALVNTGDIPEAQVQMNELLSRDPDNVMVSVLQADLYLEKGEIAKARTLYLIAKQKVPSLQIDLGIIMVTALDGDTKETAFLLKNIDIAAIADDEMLMKWLARYSRQGIERTCGSLQEIIRNIRVGSASNQMVRSAANMMRTASALDSLVSSIEPTNKILKEKHQQRVLAHKLLSQAATLVAEAIPGRDESKCSDAELTIGDCLSLIRSLE